MNKYGISKKLECEKCPKQQKECPLFECAEKYIKDIIKPYKKLQEYKINSVSGTGLAFKIKTTKPLEVSDYVNNHTPFFVRDNRLDKMFNDFYYNGNYVYVTINLYGDKLGYSNELKRVLNKYIKNNKEYSIKKVRNKLLYVLYYQDTPITRQMNYTEMERLLKNMKKVKQI